MARVIGLWKKVGGVLQPVFSGGIDLLISGANRYINFNQDVGSDGYGFRDNSGTMQFKNDGGSWTNFGGGSPGSGVTVETPSGAVNAANGTFTVSDEPQWVVSDGIIYFDGAGYSYSSLTITMDIPPSSFIRAII